MKNETQEKKSAPLLVQMLIYAAVLFVSQFISNSMPKSFPLPTAVVGLVLLYLLLTLHIIKVEWVDSFGGAMIGLIGFLFVPSGISLAANLKIMHDEGIKLVIVIILATIVLLVVTAYTTRLLLLLSEKWFHHDSGMEKQSQEDK
ncbi:CidA/LrgA family protein [Bombilactobacillus thymidiniphilus]|uniref:CidA/LrgA family protein n=1 Tax=Bombilactobacillus thymidiniphilus TaxID=2923363 RepID=A0ABY4PB48_9LACO|nr:CidA/LrgA family protein [Bombilactobacillus thymidiniphilus]UQS82954.1 CidA/LrgA family protein [Bombilactobacillus thymidiniphilus]